LNYSFIRGIPVNIKYRVKSITSDRNASNGVGLDYGPQPRVWKVYTRKRTKGVKGDVEKNA